MTKQELDSMCSKQKSCKGCPLCRFTPAGWGCSIDRSKLKDGMKIVEK